MTRLPHENRDVVGLDQSDGPQYIKYKVGPLCSVPGCSRLADHSHHLWRRSFVIGDKPWVRLWDGTITGNLTGLCWRHHDLVTEGKAVILWSELAGWFGWVDDLGVPLALDPQPPILRPGAIGYETENLSTQVSPPRRENEIPIVVDERMPEGVAILLHDHVGPGAVEKCPSCKRALPREKGPREATRAREKWTITVPVDERENGADVLDTLLDECAKLFGHDETKQVRYFTIVQALALVVQHGDRLVGDD